MATPTNIHKDTIAFRYLTDLLGGLDQVCAELNKIRTSALTPSAAKRYYSGYGHRPLPASTMKGVRALLIKHTIA